jgi:RimJ/RimL family protein N-acetyltransferase
VSAATVTLRAATLADARLLFDWLNAPDSLAQKERTTAPVAWADHRAWLERHLADPNFALFIVEEDRAPVGQVRFEPWQGAHAVDIYIAPELRGRGIARISLEAALRVSGVGVAVARVKSGNTASHRLFRSLGFTEAGSDGEVTVYQIGSGGMRRG